MQLLHNAQMEGRTTSDEAADAQLKRQAGQLQVLLSKLLQPPDGLFLSEIELSPREIRLLHALGDQGEMIMTDIASVLQAPLSTVTRMVDRLEVKGVIERLRSEEDRRIVVVKESDKGKRLHDSFRQHKLEIARRMLGPLSLGEREILLELMAKLIRGLSDAPPSLGDQT